MTRATGRGPRASGAALARYGLLALVVAACSARTPPRATALDAERAHVALGELERGRALLQDKCGGACHAAPLPSRHTAREWPAKLDEMSERAGLTFGDRHLIEQYLVALARN